MLVSVFYLWLRFLQLWLQYCVPLQTKPVVVKVFAVVVTIAG